MNEWSVARRFAARELRAGVRGFRVLIACLALGVASVAGVGSLASALTAGLKSEGRILLGGDVDLTFTHRRASAEQLDWLRASTTAISNIVEMLFELAERAVTTLMLITHDNAIAERCDRIVRMVDGRLA